MAYLIDINPLLGKQYSTEEMMQAACFQWTWNSYPSKRKTLFHVQQKAMNRVEGARFKAIGVVRGISDMVLIVPGTVVWIEMKLPSGKQSEDQIEFEELVTALGFKYYLVYSFEQFKLLIQGYYGKS